jgi:hypothetical protein
MKWDILLEDQSSLSADISQIRILVIIKYMNITTLEVKEIELLFNEKTFDVFLNNFRSSTKNITKFIKTFNKLLINVNNNLFYIFIVFALFFTNAANFFDCFFNFSFNSLFTLVCSIFSSLLVSLSVR